MKRRFHALASSSSFPWPARLREGAGQGGDQGREQGIQGRELQARHRELRARRRQATRTTPRPGSTWAAPTRRCTARARSTPENKAAPREGDRAYKKSLENNQARDSRNLKKVKINTLGALTGIYSEEPFKDFRRRAGLRATRSWRTTRTTRRTSTRSRTCYEKCNKIAEAEETYKKVEVNTLALYRQLVPEGQSAPEPPASAEASPSPSFVALENAWKACGALAAYYNKPLWDERGRCGARPAGGRRSRFDQAIDILQRARASAARGPAGTRRSRPSTGTRRTATRLHRRAEEAYAEKGLEAVDKALELKPEYFEAMIYKGLLYRVKATVAKNPRLRDEYLRRRRRSRSSASSSRSRRTQPGGRQHGSPGPAALTRYRQLTRAGSTLRFCVEPGGVAGLPRSGSPSASPGESVALLHP